MVRAGKTPCGMGTLTEEQARKLAVFAVTILENPYIPHDPTSQQARFLMCDGLEAFYGGAAGGGKALDVELPIPTPDGWKRMGDIHPGDFVFGMDGTPVRVRAESEVRNDRPCYRVVFDDGSEMVADGSHGWLTFDASEMNALTRRDDGWRARRRERRVSRASGNKSLLFTTMLMELNKNNPPPTKEAPQGTVRRTREISETVTVRGRRNHAVPVHDGLWLPDADLPIEPYLFGVWLGDGTSASGAFTTADEEIAESFRVASFRVAPLRSARCRLAPLRSASFRLAPRRSASFRLAPLRSARYRLAPRRSARCRSASFRIAPRRLARLPYLLFESIHNL